MFVRPFLSIALFVLLSIPLQSLACSCIWQGNFTDIPLKDAVIVRGQVLTHRGNSMDMTVDEVLQGKLYLEQIRIWGEYGLSCRSKLDRFEDGSEWLMVLSPITEVPDWGFNPSTPNYSFGRLGDFTLNKCGVYWLKYHNGYLSGNVDDSTRWLYLDKKKSPVQLSLIRAFIEGRADKALLSKAAHTPAEKPELLLDTKAFLMQQRREQMLEDEMGDTDETLSVETRSDETQ